MLNLKQRDIVPVHRFLNTHVFYSPLTLMPALILFFLVVIALLSWLSIPLVPAVRSLLDWLASLRHGDRSAARWLAILEFCTLFRLAMTPYLLVRAQPQGTVPLTSDLLDWQWFVAPLLECVAVMLLLRATASEYAINGTRLSPGNPSIPLLLLNVGFMLFVYAIVSAIVLKLSLSLAFLGGPYDDTKPDMVLASLVFSWFFTLMFIYLPVFFIFTVFESKNPNVLRVLICPLIAALITTPLSVLLSYWLEGRRQRKADETNPS